MNKYTNILQTLIEGSSSGLIGAAIGLMFIQLSLKDALKYAFIAMLSGSFALHLAGVSNLENYKFHIAVVAGLTGFFLIKILVLSLHKFSNAPVKNINEFLRAWKGKK